MHYPSQTAAPSRGFPDFLLRAPAASVAQPESGSTTEVSDSEDEEVEGDAGDEGPPAPAEPPPPASPRLAGSGQIPPPLQEAGASSECELSLCICEFCCQSVLISSLCVFNRRR